MATNNLPGLDLDTLTIPELVDLKRQITNKLRARNDTVKAALQVGDRVKFLHHKHGVIRGVVSRINRTNVTVLVDESRRWMVAPGLLTRI